MLRRSRRGSMSWPAAVSGTVRVPERFIVGLPLTISNRRPILMHYSANWSAIASVGNSANY